MGETNLLVSNKLSWEVDTVRRTRRSAAGATKAAPSHGLLVRVVLHLEHDLLTGLDHAADFLLAPLAVDFRGWSFGENRNETWM